MAEVRRLIGLPEDRAGPARGAGRDQAGRGLHASASWSSTTEPGIVVPALLLEPEAAKARTRWSSWSARPTGRRSSRRVGRAVWSSAGSRSWSLDLRGMGETAPPRRAEPARRRLRRKRSWRSTSAGPLLGQRVDDLLSVIAALTARRRDGVFVCRPAGPPGPIAPARGGARAEDQRRSTLTIMIARPGPTSSGRRATRDQLANVVPGALAVYDLPDLAAADRPAASDDHGCGRPGRPTRCRRSGSKRLRRVHQGATSDQGRRNRLDAWQPDRPGRRASRWSGPSTSPSASRRPSTLANGKTATVKLVAVDEPRDPIRSGGPRGARSRSRSTASRSRSARATTTCRSRSGASRSIARSPAAIGSTAATTPGGSSRTRGSGSGRRARPGSSRRRSLYPARQRWFAVAHADGQRAGLCRWRREPGGQEDLLPQRSRHRRRRGAGRGRRGDRRHGRQRRDRPARRASRTRPSARGTTWSTCSTTRAGIYRYSHLQTIDPAIKPGAAGADGAEGRRARQGRGERRLVAPALRDHEPPALRASGARRRATPSSGRPPCASRSPRSSPSPGRTAWPGPASPSCSTARSRGAARDRSPATSGPSATARPRPGPKVERTYDRPGAYSEILKVTDARGHVDYDFAIVQVLDRSTPRPAPADDPRGLCPDARDQARRPGHVQGADLPDDRRPGDLGLRRRHPDRRGPLRRQRRPARHGRLRRDRPPLRQARPLPGPRRADRPPGRHRHRAAARGRRVAAPRGGHSSGSHRGTGPTYTRTPWPRRSRGCPGSRTITHSRVRDVAQLRGVVQHGRGAGCTSRPGARPGRARSCAVGLVLDHGGLAFLDAAGELLLHGGADHLRAVGGEQHGGLAGRPRARRPARPGCGGWCRAAGAFRRHSSRASRAWSRRASATPARTRHAGPRPRHPGPAARPGAGPRRAPAPRAHGPASRWRRCRPRRWHWAAAPASAGGPAARARPRAGCARPAGPLLPGDPVPLLLGQLPRLCELEPAQLQGRLRLGQPAAGRRVFEAEQLRPLGDLLVLADQHLGDPARLEREERGHAVLQVDGAEADEPSRLSARTAAVGVAVAGCSGVSRAAPSGGTERAGEIRATETAATTNGQEPGPGPGRGVS